MRIALILYILFIPFYQGQYTDGIRKIVESPEQALTECNEANKYQTMPNGSKFAVLYKLDFSKGSIEEIQIPKSIETKRE